jgi:hypothetical protein
MENATAAGDPSVEAVDVAVTGSITATASTASTSTTAAAKAKPKAKVKKEVTAAEREVQNQRYFCKMYITKKWPERPKCVGPLG